MRKRSSAQERPAFLGGFLVVSVDRDDDVEIPEGLLLQRSQRFPNLADPSVDGYSNRYRVSARLLAESGLLLGAAAYAPGAFLCEIRRHRQLARIDRMIAAVGM